MPFKSDMDVASVFIKKSKDPGFKEDGFVLITHDLAVRHSRLQMLFLGSWDRSYRIISQ